MYPGITQDTLLQNGFLHLSFLGTHVKEVKWHFVNCCCKLYHLHISHSINFV